MHEIRVTVPDGKSVEVARIAAGAGIERVGVYKIFMYGENESREVVSAETSTPRAKAFVDALLSSAQFDASNCSITARELRAILGKESVREVTRPMAEPALDVLQDLWQLSHITSSYLGRAFAAAILLAYGMFENSAISIVVAALFLPYLSQVLAVSFGMLAGDRALARHGALALAVSTAASIAAGSLVALLYDGGLSFTDFKRPLISFALSCVIGTAAGLASADDAGRRYLIGVAAAVQYSIFPVWFGICLVRGFPDTDVVVERIGTFAINLVTIGLIAGVVYAYAGMRKETADKGVRATT